MAAAPGWYPDPAGGGWRYWDGGRWCENTAEPPRQDSVAAAARNRKKTMWTAVIVFGFLAVGVVSMLLDSAGKDEPTKAPAPTRNAAAPPAEPGSQVRRKPVSSDDFPGLWPLSMTSGTLNCLPKNGQTMVTFTTPTGITYAINGSARSMWPPIDPFWRDNPEIPGTKINIGPLLDAGLALCR